MSTLKAFTLLLFFYLAPIAAMEPLKKIKRQMMTAEIARKILGVDEKATIDDMRNAQKTLLKANNTQDQNDVNKRKNINTAFKLLQDLDEMHQNINKNKIEAQEILNLWCKNGTVLNFINRFKTFRYDLPNHEFLMEAAVDLYLDPQNVSNPQNSILARIIKIIYLDGLEKLNPTKELTDKQVLSEARSLLGIDENTTRSERQEACVTKLANLRNTRTILQNKNQKDYDLILAANAIGEYAHFDDIVQQKKTIERAQEKEAREAKTREEEQKKIAKEKEAQDASSASAENITEQAKNASEQTNLQNKKSSFIYPTFAQAGGAIALLTLLGSGIALYYYLIQPEDTPTEEDNGEDYEDVGEDKKDDDEDARAPESEMVE